MRYGFAKPIVVPPSKSTPRNDNPLSSLPASSSFGRAAMNRSATATAKMGLTGRKASGS